MLVLELVLVLHGRAGGQARWWEGRGAKCARVRRLDLEWGEVTCGRWNQYLFDWGYFIGIDWVGRGGRCGKRSNSRSTTLRSRVPLTPLSIRLIPPHS